MNSLPPRAAGGKGRLNFLLQAKPPVKRTKRSRSKSDFSGSQSNSGPKEGKRKKGQSRSYPYSSNLTGNLITGVPKSQRGELRLRKWADLARPRLEVSPWNAIQPLPLCRSFDGQNCSLRTKVKTYLLSLKYFRKGGLPKGLVKSLPAVCRPLGGGFYDFRALHPASRKFSLPKVERFLNSLNSYESIFRMSWRLFRKRFRMNFRLNKRLILFDKIFDGDSISGSDDDCYLDPDYSD